MSILADCSLFAQIGQVAKRILEADADEDRIGVHGTPICWCEILLWTVPNNGNTVAMWHA